jgi:3-phosphoshikimate 1-carboxyvinyltransferase
MSGSSLSRREVCGSGPLRGEIRVPGDKSISHRSVIFSALAQGEARVTGLSGGEDVERTLTAFQMMGVEVERGPEAVVIRGRGLRGLSEPTDVLDCGNSGTTTRLLMGILAGQPFFSAFTGDASLRSRPMARAAVPLRAMGATILGRHGGDRLPMAIVGGRLSGGVFTLPVASAQLKSALMLAGLFADGDVSITEPALSRDHTERAFRFYGLPIRQSGLTVYTGPGRDYSARPISVPGDISAAAFFLVAASLVPGSDLVIRDVGMNPSRSGIVDALQAMGADITVLNPRSDGPEPVADLRVRAARLHATVIEGALVPRMIDEIPVLTVAAAYAGGRTIIRDAAELRVKESDRIRTMALELGKAGIEVDERPDGMEIDGGQRPVGGAEFASHGDHRIAMSMAVLGSTLETSSFIHDVGCIDTSFPGFFDTLAAAQRG